MRDVVNGIRKVSTFCKTILETKATLTQTTFGFLLTEDLCF